jgi:hypothetical protein
MKQYQPRCHRYSDRETPVRHILAFAVLLCLLVPSLLFAQAINQPSSSDKEDAIEKLKEQLQQIEEQHHKEIAHLKDRLGVVEQHQSSLSDELVQNIRVGAYGAVAFESFGDRRTSHDGNFEV